MRYQKLLLLMLVLASLASATPVVSWGSSTVDTVVNSVNAKSGSGASAILGTATKTSARGIVGRATGTSGVGVEGLATASGSAGMVAEGVDYGIHAYSPSGFGVKGLSIDSVGVYGVASGNNGKGLVAVGGFVGVDATSSGTGNLTYGVQATGAGANDTYGIYATACCDSTDYAGFFDGNVFTTGQYTGSDAKLKKNIQILEGGLDKILALKPRSYDMKADEFKGNLNLPRGKQYGLIAQELKTVFPGLVQSATAPPHLTVEEKEKGVKKENLTFEAVNYVALIPVLIRAIQEQQAKIEALEASR